MIHQDRDKFRWGEIRRDLMWLVYIVKINQQVLATRLSVHQTTISRWINEGKYPKIPLDRIESCIRKYKRDSLSSWRYACSKAPRYKDNRHEAAAKALEQAIPSLKVHPEVYRPKNHAPSVLFSSSIVAIKADLAGEAEAYVFSNIKHPRHFLILVEHSLSENESLEALQTELIGHVLPLLGKDTYSNGSETYGDWHLWTKID